MTIPSFKRNADLRMTIAVSLVIAGETMRCYLGRSFITLSCPGIVQLFCQLADIYYGSHNLLMSSLCRRSLD